MYGDSRTALHASAFSQQPLSFVASEVNNELGSIQAIHLIENGPHAARACWQTAQLNHLISFARSRSRFWQQRLPDAHLAIKNLAGVQPLTRQSLTSQVATEGSLVQPKDGQEVKGYASSGSTGTPVRVHYLAQNARYNELRSLAQYFIEDRDLNHNRTFIKPANATELKGGGQNMRVEIMTTWLGQVSSVFQGGHHKIIQIVRSDAALIEELRTHPVGYLACLGSQMEWLIDRLGNSIADLGIHMWLHHSDNLNPGTRERLSRLGIKSQSIYSCSEVGLISFECAAQPGYHHVAHSNVIVEASDEAVDCEGLTLNKLLVTHLHSYATPIIRYELGDFGTVAPACPCGHEGTTISNVYGRKKFFIQTGAGPVFFPFFSAPLQSVLDIQEISMRQMKLDAVEVDVVSAKKIAEEDISLAARYLKSITSDEIEFEMRQVEAIDWSQNPKRLPFVCYLP